MAFGATQQQRGTQSGAKFESPYIKLVDDRLIRILDEEEIAFWRYFIPVNVGNGRTQGRSICVGMDNPIKTMMNGLGAEHPNFRKVENRMVLNVLDRTPVVRWADGTTLYADKSGRFTNPESGAALQGVKPVPNNRVMILEFGKQLMEFFVLYHNRLRDRVDMDVLLPIQRIDLRISTMGSGLDTKRIVTADVDTRNSQIFLATICGS
jgi:hypothetical protein